MSLSLVATPIGNIDDITLRALKTLKEAEVIIGEEYREMTTLLKKLDIPKPQLERLNEHSDPEEVQELLKLCKEKKVALISDCGTPGFCDPGADLVQLCRKNHVEIIPVPGASSLMTLLSISGRKTKDFYFRGFLPAKKEEREKAVKETCKDPRPQILMDTPYRLKKLLSELAQTAPKRRAVIGIDMTSAEEQYIEGSLKELQQKLDGQKAEFVLFVDGMEKGTQ